MKFIKRITQGVLAAGFLVLGLGAIQKAQATASTDTITVSVTVTGVNYGVQITSPDPGGYSFGNVALGATTGSTVAITVANMGSISEYFSMAVSSTSNGGITHWGPVSSAPGLDQFELMGLFTSTSTVIPPTLASFVSPTDAMLFTSLGTAGHNVYGQTNGAMNNDDSLGRTPPSAQVGFKRSLWMQLIMPSDISDGNNAAQTMTLSIDGQGT
jgi:hypothetical protein